MRDSTVGRARGAVSMCPMPVAGTDELEARSITLEGVTFGQAGGAFNYDGPGLRVTNRVHHPGGFRLVMAGFRCARSP